MGNGITVNSLEDANEYVSSLREQGYDGKVSQDRRTGTYKVKVVAPQQKQQKVTVEASENRGEGIAKAARMIGKGFGDIGRSLGTPSTSKRPRTSQMPGSRREIGISQQINLEKLKMPGLRGKTLSGRNRVR